MTISPRQALQAFKRFPSIKSQQNNLFVHQRTNTMNTYDKLSKSMNIPKLLLTDRSTKASRMEETDRTIKNSNKIQRQDSTVHNSEFNRKLLSDIQSYNRQVTGLQNQNKKLMKLLKETEKHNEILRRRLAKFEHFDFETPIKNYKEERKEDNDDSHIEQTSTGHFDHNSDMKMIISRHIPFMNEQQKQRYEEKIQIIEEENEELKSRNRELEFQLQTYRREAIIIEKNTKKPDTRKNSIESISIQTQATQPQQIYPSGPPSFFKSLRQLELEDRVQKLQSQVRQMENHHTKIKNRCSTIRNLVTKVK